MNEICLGNGTVDFDEFLTMMRRRRSAGDCDSELRQVFRVISFVSSCVLVIFLFS